MKYCFLISIFLNIYYIYKIFTYFCKNVDLSLIINIYKSIYQLKNKFTVIVTTSNY